MKYKADHQRPQYRPEAADPRPPMTQAELEQDTAEWMQKMRAKERWRRLRRGES
jgi:hypothetical protein